MEWIRVAVSRVAGLMGGRKRDAELDAELREHIALATEEKRRQGLSDAEARTAALREFGGVTQIKERYRVRRGVPFLEQMARDVRYGCRQLWRSPGFTATAVLSLALGLGANTAIFSLFDAVLLHPLPYHDPGQLMLVSESEPSQGQDENGVAIQEAGDYQSRDRLFAQMGTYESAGFNLTGDERPLRVNAAMVSSSIFPLLGAAPVLGRTFTTGEDTYGNNHVVVLSWQLWKSQYGGDTQIVGKTIRLDEVSYTVVGVMPPAFRFPFDGKPLSEMADLWVPDAIAPSRLKPDNRLMEFGVGLIGRLRPGVSQAQAAAEMTAIARGFEQEHPDVYAGGLHVEPHTHLFAAYAMEKARPVVILLMVAVGCVLLIACANTANLLLARASHREREMAVRAAVGASRTRLIRQCLVESLVLAAGGALLGLLLAEGILETLRIWGPESVPRLHDATLNPAALGFTALLTLATGIAFGLAPAWKTSRTVPHASLKERAQAGSGRSGRGLQDVLAVSEVALALVLLVASGLLIRSLADLVSTPIGFDPHGTLVVRTMFDRARYPDMARRDVVQGEILERLRDLPGISGVAAASHLPLSDERQIGVRLEHAPPNDFHWAENSLVSPGYFQVMGIPLLRGRDFNAQDRPESVPVAIVSQAFVRQYLSGANPIGQKFYWGDRALFTVVGVAADVHIAALDADPAPMVYNSMFQVQSGASGRMAIVLRAAGEKQIDIDPVKRIISSVDPELPLYETTSLSTLIDASLAQRRFTLLLLCGFAGCAVLLATIGLYGVLAYLVERRRQEIGVRMALGASRAAILRMVVRRGLTLALAGCGLGLPLAMLGTIFLRANLYHVGRFDPLTLAAACSLLSGIVLLAALIPARRAASVDPMQALRTE